MGILQKINQCSGWCRTAVTILAILLVGYLLDRDILHNDSRIQVIERNIANVETSLDSLRVDVETTGEHIDVLMCAYLPNIDECKDVVIE